MALGTLCAVARLGGWRALTGSTIPACNRRMQLPSFCHRPSSVGLATIIAGLIVGSAEAVACSGPGAADAIRLSGQIALVSWTLTILCFLCSLIVRGLRRRLGKRGVIGLGAAVFFHPAIWFSTLSGDCGYMTRLASIVFVPLLAMAFTFLVWRGHRRLTSPQPESEGKDFRTPPGS
jgi:hypothetical protein